MRALFENSFTDHIEAELRVYGVDLAAIALGIFCSRLADA